MKKLFVSLLAICALFACNSQKSFNVTVSAGDDYELTETSAVALTYRTTIDEKDTLIKFVAPLVNGNAKITGSVDDIYRAALYLLESEEAEPVGRPIAQFFLENELYDISLSNDKDNPVVIAGGGELQKVYTTIQDEQEKIFGESNFRTLYDSLMKDPGNKILSDTVNSLYNALSEKAEKIKEDYLTSNPASIYALYDALSNRYYMSVDSLKGLVANFKNNGSLVKSKFFKTLSETLTEREAVAPGAQAPDFTLNDPDGNPISLSEFYAKNKVTMIDFWASWCGPCRRFNPTLVAIYNKFKDKGFDILGVSLDREGDKDKWLKAIEDDGLTWTHVSDLAYWDCAPAKLYSVKYIPQSFFVDSEGKILLASPEHNEIEPFLEEYLK